LGQRQKRGDTKRAVAGAKDRGETALSRWKPDFWRKGQKRGNKGVGEQKVKDLENSEKAGKPRFTNLYKGKNRGGTGNVEKQILTHAENT